MKKRLLEKLITEYKKLFLGVFETGGGYGFRYYHGLRVMTYCRRILRMPYFKRKKADQEVLLIAALFADIGKLKAINKKGQLIYGSIGNQSHAEWGARLIPEYISKYIKNNKLIRKVAHIIREQHHNKQTTIESKLVKDADRLDNYGVIQIWRHITYAHYDQRNIDRLKEYWVVEGGRKLAKTYLKKFHFPPIKKLAKVRFQKLDSLISEIDKESLGEDIV